MQRFFAEPHIVFRQKLRSFVMAEQEHPVLCGGASFGILIFRVYTGIVDFRQENARGFLGRKGGVKKRTVQPGAQAAAFPCDRILCVVIGQRFQGAFVGRGSRDGTEKIPGVEEGFCDGTGTVGGVRSKVD